jgi:hypothetical protein
MESMIRSASASICLFVRPGTFGNFFSSFFVLAVTAVNHPFDVPKDRILAFVL